MEYEVLITGGSRGIGREIALHGCKRLTEIAHQQPLINSIQCLIVCHTYFLDNQALALFTSSSRGRAIR